MNRIATTLTTLTASVLLGQSLGAAEPTLQTLDSRLGSLEARLISIEKALNENSSSYSYNNAATLEATKGTTTSATTPLSATTPATTAPAAAAPAAPQTYTIQDGDTLGKIATKFGIERKSLLEANRLSEGQPIYIGETLMVPAGAVAPAPAPAPPVTNVAKTTPQIPAPPVPTGNAADANKPAPVKQESIVVGETKKTAPASTTLHTVAKGDTLTSLSKKYGTSVESLKTANGLRSDAISLGQSLKIPTVKAAETAGNTKTTPAPQPEKPQQTNAFQYDNPLLKQDEAYGYYTVVKNDNLYAIARDFFTTMAELQRINNMGSSTVIKPGDDIIVPTSKYNAYHKEGEVANR